MRSEMMRGSRQELIEILTDLAEGWYHLANDRMRAAAVAALGELGRGAATARAGHTVYVVAELAGDIGAAGLR